MSFVDLMGSDRWSEADIKTRLHALIRTQFSQEIEEESTRASLGAALGQHVLTTEEYQKIIRFKNLTAEVDVIAHQARGDAILLNAVLDAELHINRLKLAPVALTVVGEYIDDTNLTAEENLLLKEAHTLTQTEEALRDNQMAYDLDQEERDIAQAALDFLPADVAALINVRNPIVE